MVAIPKNRLAHRIEAIGESATLAVDARAKALRAQGASVIGFGAGEPDFPTPAHIVEAAAAAAADPANHRYSPTGGLPELRAAIASKTQRDSGYSVASEQVVVCNGGKHALFNTFACLLDPGDEVLVPAPYWVSYPEMIKLAEGIPVPVVTTAASGFRASIAQLEAAVTERTKALLFVSPSNPTGAVYPPEEVAEVGRWAAQRGLWVITDEIYEHLVYGDARFASMPVLVPDIADRCVVINGVAKTYAMTGWRVGWLIAPNDLAQAVIRLQSHATSNVANVAQAAALAAVSGTLEAAHGMREAFDRRRRTMHKMLTEIDGVITVEPEGAFYAFPSFEAFLGGTVAGRPVASSLELAEVVLDEAKVAFVPGEAFGAPGYGRLSYALADDDMVEGINRIAQVLTTAEPAR